MFVLHELAKDFSSLISMPVHFQKEICLFEMGNRTSMIFELQGEKDIFISLCYKAESEKAQYDIFMSLLKLMHPLRDGLFFHKVLLLDSYIVVSMLENMNQLSPAKIYQFQKQVVKKMMRSGVRDI